MGKIRFILTRCLAGVLMLFTMSSNVQSQEDIDVSPPNKVLESFSLLFPEYSIMEWHNRESGRFVAECFVENTFCKIHFSRSGKWLKTMLFIDLDELGFSLDQILKNISGGEYILHSFYQSETPDEKVYFVVFEHKKVVTLLKLNEDGNVLSRRSHTFKEMKD